MKTNLKKIIRLIEVLLKSAARAADESFRKSNNIYDRVSAGKEQHLRASYHLFTESR